MTDQIALLVSIAALLIVIAYTIFTRPSMEVYVMPVPTELQASLDKISADLDALAAKAAEPTNDADILAAVQALQAKADGLVGTDQASQ